MKVSLRAACAHRPTTRPIIRGSFLVWLFGTLAALALSIVSVAPSRAASGPMSGLFDNFDGDSLDTSIWTVGLTGGGQNSGISVVNTYNQLQIAPLANMSSPAYNGLYSESTYNLNDSYAFIQVLQVASGSAAGTALVVHQNPSNHLDIEVEDGVIYFQITDSSTVTTLASEPYSPKLQAWWRIREASSITYWETSPDGMTWTPQAQASDPFTLSNVKVALTAGTSASVASPGEAIFDNLNVAPTSAPAATPTVTTPAALPISYLSDSFTDGSLNTSLWTIGQIGGGQNSNVTVAETTSGLVITPLNNAATASYNGVYSTATYNLSNGAVFVHAMQTAAGAFADTSLDLTLNASNTLDIVVENGSIYFQKVVGGSKTTLLYQPYSPTTHAWWRIREASGTVYWETAPDGITWTTRAQAADPFSVSSMRAALNAGTFLSLATPGQAVFTNLNVGPTSPTSTSTPTASPSSTTTAMSTPTPTRTPTITATAPVSRLFDSFTDGSLNTSLWTIGQIGGGQNSNVRVVETTGGLQITPLNNTATASYNGAYSTATYNLSNGAVFVHTVQSAVGAYTDTSLDLALNASNTLDVVVENGSIYFQKVVGGSKTTLLSQPYSTSTHAWWRIREASGTVYWETAPDGTTWTTRAQAADPFSVTSIQVALNAGTYQSVATPGQATFNNLNVAPITSTPTATATSTAAATVIPTPTAPPSTRTGTVYFTGDFSTGDMNQYSIHTAGNLLAPMPSSNWDQRIPNNGNGSAIVQSAVTRPGYAHALKLDLYPDAEIQSIIANNATSGTFTLSWNGTATPGQTGTTYTTGPIAYNAGQNAVATALNALPNIQAAGGVVVHTDNDQGGVTLHTLPNSPMYIGFKNAGYGRVHFTANSSTLSGGILSLTGGASSLSDVTSNDIAGRSLSSAAWVAEGNDVYYGMSFNFASGSYPEGPLVFELGYPLIQLVIPSSTQTLNAELLQDGNGNWTGLAAPAFQWIDTTGRIATNTWTDIVIHVYWTANSNGLFEIWKNGTKVWSGSARTLPSDSAYCGSYGGCLGPLNAKIANYHGGANTTTYVTAVRIGSSYSAVAP